MDAYVKNKHTGAITKTKLSLAGDYLNTGDWELSSASDYERQQKMESMEDVQEEQSDNKRTSKK